MWGPRACDGLCMVGMRCSANLSLLIDGALTELSCCRRGRGRGHAVCLSVCRQQLQQLRAAAATFIISSFRLFHRPPLVRSLSQSKPVHLARDDDDGLKRLDCDLSPCRWLGRSVVGR